ncbi:MAG: MFS transporter [Bryobacterales bacterium]|nr:MFS transporter [Bryobacterales bacterium]
MRIDRYRWVLVGVLFLVGAVNYADRTAFSSVLPLVRTDLGVSDVVLGAVGSVFLWSYGLVSPLAGMAGDRFARTSIILFSLIAWSLVTGLSGLVRSGAELLSIRVLLGFSEALYLPAALALIAAYHASETRARAMAIHNMGLNFGFVLGGVLAGFLGERFGWRVSLLALASLGLGMAAVCRMLFHPRLRPPVLEKRAPDVLRPSPFTVLKKLATTPSYLVLIFDSMAVSIGMWVFAYWLPLFYRETFHLSLTQSGLYGTLTFSGGAWLGILCGGWLSDRVVARAGVRQRMILQVFCYTASMPFLMSFVWSNSVLFISLSLFLFNLFLSMGSSNNTPLVCDLLEPGMWSTAVGVANLMNCLMGGSGIFFAGLFKQELGLRWVFAGVTGTVMVAALALVTGYFVFLEKDLAKRKAAAN